MLFMRLLQIALCVRNSFYGEIFEIDIAIDRIGNKYFP